MQVLEFLTPTNAKIRNAKGRKEYHGEAKVLALDLSLMVKTNATALDMIDKRLRPAFFAAVPPDEEVKKFDQMKIDSPQNELPHVRFPHLQYPMKLDYEYLGHQLRLDYGRGGDADKVVNLCKMKSIWFTPIEGGSIELYFSLSSAADITGTMVGIFSELIQQETTITLLRAKEEAKQPSVIDASSDGDAPKDPAAPPKSEDKKAAESADKKASSNADAATKAFVNRNTPPAGEASSQTH